MNTPPVSVEQLQQRAYALAGRTVAELAHGLCPVPENLNRQKGWLGQLLEQLLGADAGNEARADFTGLGIELKTLPVDFRGRVLESTYVCVVDLRQQQFEQFEQSLVFEKLRHVLWVPIARPSGTAVADAVIGSPFFWQPNAAEFDLIKNDWEHTMDLVSRGQLGKINSRNGEVMQVRPKAAHSRVLTESTNQQGEQQLTLPRGFYLRPSFTQALLDRALYR